MGEAHWMKGDPGKAEAYFLQAIDIARNQSAKLFELSAATSLASLWHHEGKHSESHDLLAPVFAWFTEGFGTRDLKKARALLDKLSPAPT
jgi:predicted ATPase